MEKSTVKTSRKIYAMKMGFVMVGLLTLIYAVLAAMSVEIDSIVFVTGLGSIGGIVSALNIADGMKGHEK